MRKVLPGLLAALIVSPMAVSAQDNVVRVGYLAQVHDGPLLALRDALGEEYQLEFVRFLRYADAEVALIQGDIDITSLGYVSAITAASRGGEPAYQFFVGQSRGAINLVCKDGIEVTDWADIPDYTVGVLTGGPAEIFFNDAVTLHGVDLQSIERVTFPVPGPPLLQALEDGTIECMAVFEPFAASAVADGYGYYPPLDLADNSFFGVNGGVAANAEFIARNPEFLLAATQVIVDAAESYPADKTPWVASVVEVLGIAERVAEISTEHLVLDWRLYRERIGTLAEAVATLGVITQAPSAEAIDGFFNYEFLLEATGETEAGIGLHD